jgi:multiple sugar transport system ATP-binding protein
MSGVKVQGLRIAYGGQDVIRSLDLEVAEGEFVVLLGPSGCGKSTLLHGIAGLVDTRAGRIEIGGRDMSHAEPAERGIGMVFQSYALYPTMTVERNLSFGLRVAGLPRAEIELRVRHAAQLLQLEPLLSRKPSQLSGGQRQRVAIGRALVRKAGVFLFDEPLSNLDAKLRAELRRELKLLHQRLGSTMIYVTHDQVEAMTLATRVVVMRAGAVEQIGPPVDVYRRPETLFVAGFLGAPGMNFIHGRLRRGGRGLAFDAPDLTQPLDGYPLRSQPKHDADSLVVLGVRPEHVRLAGDGAFQGRVQLVEAMGSHRVVWLALGSITLAALCEDERTLAAGDTLRFDLDAQRLSLFDAISERRL